MERVERTQSTLPSPLYDLFKILVPGYWAFILAIAFLAVNFPTCYSALAVNPAFPWLSVVSGLLLGLFLYDIDYPKNRRKFEEVRNIERLSGKWFFFDLFKQTVSHDTPYLDENRGRHQKLATYLDYYVLNSMVDSGTKERVYYFMSTYHLFAQLRFVTYWFSAAQLIVLAASVTSVLTMVMTVNIKAQMPLSGFFIFATIAIWVVTILVQNGHARRWIYPEHLATLSNPISDGLLTNWRFLIILASGLVTEATVCIVFKVHLDLLNMEGPMLLVGGALVSFLLSRPGNKGDRYLVSALETLRIWFDLHREEVRNAVSPLVRQENRVGIEASSIEVRR